MDKYAIYLRKSRADVEAEKLGEGETLARHREILTALAARKGLCVGQIYQEIISGETIQDRPAIQQLIKDCYAGMYRGIIIVEVTRLSRGNQGDAQIILDCLKYANRNSGLLVITPTKVYDVAHSQEDEEFMEFELFMSRREYKMIQKRLDRGRKQAVVEGNYMGSYRPYGYDIVKTKSGRTLVPNPSEAPIVQDIYSWAVNDHMTPGRIASRLNMLHVPTYTGAPEWNLSTIKSILSNPTYAGKVRWNDRMCVKTMVDGQIVKSRPRSTHTDHYMLYDVKHKANALVDEETFAAASSRFYSDKTKGGLSLQNPLAGILVFKHCGKAMVYQEVHRNGSYYRPRFIHRQSDVCSVRSALVSDVMDALVHAFRQSIDDFQMIVDNKPDDDSDLIRLQIDSLRSDMLKYKKRISKLFDAWEDGAITDLEFGSRKSMYKEKIEQSQKQIAALECSIPDPVDYREKIMSFHDVLDALLNPEIDAQSKNEFLKQILSSVEFSRENFSEFVLDVNFK